MSSAWKSMDSTGRVYTLADPRNGMIRYVGATTATLKTRLSGHCAATRPSAYGQIATAPVVTWVTEVLAAGLRPVIAEVAEVPARELAEAERAAIADHYRDGWPIVNVTDVPGYTSFSEAHLDVLHKRVKRLESTGGRLLADTMEELARVEVHVQQHRADLELRARRNPSDPQRFEEAAHLCIDEWEACPRRQSWAKPLSAGDRADLVRIIVDLALTAHRHGVTFGVIANEVGESLWREMQGLPFGHFAAPKRRTADESAA